MKLPVRDATGGKQKPIEVDDQVFGIKPNMAVIHQAFLAQMANRRAGSASTKSRGEVRGSTAKVRTQKGSGHARQGSARAPHRRGGGVAFGPKPRSYHQALPKRMRRLAIRSVISGKVADGQLSVVNELLLEKPRTKEITGLLEGLGIERSALIVTGDPDRNVHASVRNLTRTKVLPAAYLNVVDMLTHRDVVMTVAAVRRCEELWGGDHAHQRRPLAAQLAAVAAPAARRTRKAKTVEEVVPEEAAPEAKAPRRTRKAKAVEDAAPKAEAVPEAERAPEAKAPRRTRKAKAVEDAAPKAEAVPEAERAPEAKAPRRTRKAKAVEDAAPEAEAAPEAKAPRRTRKAKAVEDTAPEAEAAPSEPAAEEEAR